MIKGLLYRDGKDVLYNGNRKVTEDVDSIGFPRYEYHELSKYGANLRIPVVSSRGCLYECIYCPVKLSIGKKMRLRSPVSVADELEYWYRKGIREFDVADDNFTFNKQRVCAICDEIKNRGLADLRITLDNGVRADKVDRSLLEKMRGAGFYSMAFGVESGNNRILKNIKKGMLVEVMENAISDACELGYKVTLFFCSVRPEKKNRIF